MVRCSVLNDALVSLLRLSGAGCVNGCRVMDKEMADQDGKNGEESTDVEPGLIYRTTSSMPNDEESDRS